MSTQIDPESGSEAQDCVYNLILNMTKCLFSNMFFVVVMMYRFIIWCRGFAPSDEGGRVVIASEMRRTSTAEANSNMIPRVPFPQTFAPSTVTKPYPCRAPINPSRTPYNPCGAPNNPSMEPYSHPGAPNNTSRTPYIPAGAPYNPARAPNNPSVAPYNRYGAPTHPCRTPCNPSGALNNPYGAPFDPSGMPNLPNGSEVKPYLTSGAPNEMSPPPTYEKSVKK